VAEIDLEIVNNSGQTVGLRVEKDGETHEYLKTLVRREDLRSVTAKTGARKAPAKAPAGEKPPAMPPAEK
jgi:predicted DNA-binding protein with PD1-like motif